MDVKMTDMIYPSVGAIVDISFEYCRNEVQFCHHVLSKRFTQKNSAQKQLRSGDISLP